jgi:hypothetical protein
LDSERHRNQYLSGQIGKLLGFSVESQRIIPATARDLRQASADAGSDTDRRGREHGDVICLARLLPRFPSALITLIAAGAVVACLGYISME